ncbi:hypothetical protein K439DRAFT_1643189, partial [Ramaria rubella]
MESYLKTRHKWLLVIGRSPEPEFVDVNLPTWQEHLNHREWLETKDSAAGTIFLCIDDSQKDHVRDCKHNPEMINADPRFSTYDAFFSIHKEENESLTELTGRVSRAMAHIKSLRPSHFGLQQLNEELQSMALICTLPLDYSTMKASTIPTAPSVICGWCSRTGHAEENCYSKKLSQQRDQNTAEKGTLAEVKEETASIA